MDSRGGRIPENLKSLWREELEIRKWAEGQICATPHLIEHISFIEAYMDCVDSVRKLDNKPSRKNALTSIFLRTFDNFGAAVREAMSGNYRLCAMLLRDQLEVHFLLDYLLTEDGRPEAWMKALTYNDAKEYTPRAIRTALDKRDVEADSSKNGKSRRGVWYHELSALGSHAGPYGFELSRDGTRALRAGPFKQADSLRQCIEEAAKIGLLLAGQLLLYSYEFGEAGLSGSSELSLKYQKVFEENFAKPDATDI